MKPILFNTEMVRTLMDGRKSVTRRTVKPQPEGAHTVLDCDDETHTFELLCGNGGAGSIFADWNEAIKAPYWPGDILYVRETWGDYSECQPGGAGYYLYRADFLDGAKHYDADGHKCDLPRWHPSIHMPKEAARLFLRVTDVRVERLQDITSADCQKEGVDLTDLENLGVGIINHEVYTQEFQALWDSTVKKANLLLYGWDANPWVWVIEFERITKEEAVKEEDTK